MKTIIIAGASSTAGKTALAVALLNRLPSHTWAGVKITVTDDIIRDDPRRESRCESSLSGYRIITDPQILTEPGTDTGRMSEAGANPVLWAITTPAFVRSAWDDLKQRLKSVEGAVIESNSLALCIEPDITFFTINPRVPRSQWKTSAPALIEQGDFVIISLHDIERERAQDLIDEIHAQRHGRGVIVTEAVEKLVDLRDVQEKLRLLSTAV